MNKLELIEKEAAEELEHLKAKIVHYDLGFHGAFARQMGCAYLAGMALNRAKEIVPHGKFMAWREAELPVSNNSAARYMKFADALGKFPTVGNLKEVKLLARGKELSPAQQKKITEAVHELADGKTLTEMYRDLGVIRQPEKPKHHPRKPVSVADTLAARRAHAEDLLHAFAGPLRIFLNLAQDEEDANALPLDRAGWERALAIGTELNTTARERLKHLKGGAK